MAAKVNVKFVVMLGTALGLVLAGMAAVFFFVLKKSGEDWARKGDEAMAAQDYEAADQAFSFAVAHDRTNVEWMKRWLDAMGHRVIENEIDFEDRYAKDYRGVMRQIAHMGRTADLEAHVRYLDLVTEGVTGSTLPANWRFLLTEARAAQSFYSAGSTPEPGVTAPEEWHRLYRYSGFALSVLYTMNLTENEEEVAACERDLRLALVANPGDSDAALELSNFYALGADRRRTTPPVDLAAADRLEQQARRVLEEMLDRNPDEVGAAMGLLRMDVVVAGREMNARLGNQRSTRAVVDAMLAPFEPRVEAIYQALLGRAATGIDAATRERFAGIERMVTPAARMERTTGLLEAILAARPDDVNAMLMLGGARQFRSEYREAIEVMQRLVDLPPKPLGPEGWLLIAGRSSARLRQAECALSMYDGAAEESERAAVMEEAARYRTELAKLVPADSPMLLKIDARVAFLQGDWQTAERLLLAVNERTGGSDNEVMWWLAQTEVGLGKLGEARRLLERLDEAQPDNPTYMIAMAAVEKDLRNTEHALAIAEELERLYPDSEEVRRVVAEIRGTNDPVRAALDRFRATAEGGPGVLGDPEKALADLEADFEANGRDPAIGSMLLQTHLMSRDIPAALAVVESVLVAHPDAEGYERLRTALGAGEYVPALIQLITTGEGTDTQKALNRRAVYLSNNMPDEAANELRTAAALSPRDRPVVEALFLDAASRGDTAEIARLVALAREHNVDGMGGEVFEVQRLILEEKHREAVTSLERLVTQSPNEAWLWRQLGLERIQVGRMDDAVTALRRAIEIRPNDVQSAKELAGLLGTLGRDAQALQVARASEPFGRGDVGYLNMLWVLETRAGDRMVALAGREALRARDATLLWNNASLAELYMDLGRWAEARALIDEMRGAQDSLMLVGLDARWHADQADFAGAARAYTGYIGKLPAAELNTDPFLAWAAFMQSREQLSLAEAALASGRVHQSPETMDCDRMLGDLMTLGQRLSEAVEAYTRVVEANADTPDFTFRKRLVEALINLDRFDEARVHLTAMSSAAATDRNLMLLTAELARKSGDRAAAARQLDECVRLFPDDPVVYYQRAEFLLDEDSRQMDALADFDTAIRKGPRFWQALRNRSGVYRQLGRTEEAVADLRSAIVAAGTDGEAVTQMLGELMYLKRTAEAVSAADEAAAARPTDVVFLQRIAGVFAARSEWAAAARFAQRAFELRKETAIAQRYLDCLLQQRPPQTRMAEDVLNAMGPEVAKSAGLLAASVMVNVQRNRVQEAERDATAAFDLASANPGQLVLWHTTMVRAFGDATAYQAYLRRLAAAKQSTALKDWPVLFLAISQTRETSTSALAIESLNRLANEGQPIDVRLNAMRTIGSTVYGYGDHSQAAEIWTTALRAFPDDWEMNNNLAYVLTEHLGRAEEALPYALKALENQRRSSSVNDTVGWTYFKTGNKEQALEHLWSAFRLSRDAAEQAGVVEHLLEVYISDGDKANAERVMTYFHRLLSESPWLDAAVRTRAQELETRINSLP